MARRGSQWRGDAGVYYSHSARQKEEALRRLVPEERQRISQASDFLANDPDGRAVHFAIFGKQPGGRYEVYDVIGLAWLDFCESEGCSFPHQRMEVLGMIESTENPYGFYRALAQYQREKTGEQTDLGTVLRVYGQQPDRLQF